MNLHGRVISFRADASLLLGTGHVRRCLTLADELRLHGATCQFICVNSAGHLIREVTDRGHAVYPVTPDAEDGGLDELQDANETNAILAASPSTLVVVDHYSLGASWESLIRSGGRRIVAIDDLANRTHSCDILVDQNLGRSPVDYQGLVPSGCQILTGPRFASLRREFLQWRQYSLRRREGGRLVNLFVSVGGVDHSNVTGQCLAALRQCTLPAGCRIVVVLGEEAPWANEVHALADRLPWATEVLLNTTRMSELMANSDLAIGAAGGTAWERCCLGLPTIMVVVADNQRPGAAALAKSGAAYDLGDPGDLHRCLPKALEAMNGDGRLAQMSLAASCLVDGRGAARVCEHLGGLIEGS